MITIRQFEANRLNAQKSTGPRSAEGKAAIRFNALKTGIHAQSQVIPGEDPAALTLLTAEYYDRYQPATPEVRALVDTLINAEWLQRRFRTLEAQLWQWNIQGLYNPVKGFEMAQVCDPGCDDFNRLQRRIDAADRTYHRTLLTLQKIESLAPDPRPPAPGPASEVSLPQPHERSEPEIGFVPPIPAPPAGPVPLDPGPRSPAPGPASEASLPPAPDPRPREPDEPEIGFDPSTSLSVVGQAIRLTAAPPPEDGEPPMQ
jgi:hypothetical protein